MSPEPAAHPPTADRPRMMRALSRSAYGPPDVIDLIERPVPAPRDDEILVRVRASAVNTADWRIRAGAFPGILAIPGRLMFGITRPRNPYLGSEFAGTVAKVGRNVTRLSTGDRVFGIVTTGCATAEFLAVRQTAAIARIPDALGFGEAAALPFGGLCALTFLSDYAELEPGQRLLVVGASGGVGTYAVQIGKAMGALVTGVASGANAGFVERLGAEATVDYTRTPVSDWPGGFDVVLDTVGALRPVEARRLLVASGLFLPLNFGLREIGAAVLNPLRSRKIKLAVNEDKAEGLAELATMVTADLLRPVAEHRFPLDQARAAHALVESRHRRGSVILELD